MNLLADESVDRQIVERLRQDGHQVVYVAELSPSVDDEVVLADAESRQALLVTADKDFGELVYRQGRLHSGILLLRLAGIPLSQKAESVAGVIRAYESELAGRFSVMSPGLLRIRRMP